ncbi:MAG TPA: peptidylprolyl isomerase [Steroidobacteraceae bacterium]|jgi:parvulin-like peptidyl-prolyl isomerase|nr:peptidylprolyl isomerase [Steroidobacteraceae bacterium]
MPIDQNAKPSWRNLAQVSNARSFLLMAAGVLTGLFLAGYSLFTARSTSTLIVPAEDVALVNQQPVSRADYLALLQTLYGVDLSHATPEQRRKALDDMIREELFVQRGKELDVASTDPDVRGALVNAVELEIAENAITAQPSEAALRQFYETHQDRYVSEGIMRVRDLVFPASALADLLGEPRALKAAISEPEALARLNGRDSGRVKGDEFYFAAKIHLGDQLFEAAKDLADGAVSKPIRLADGIHVLDMQSNKRPVPFEFTRARSQVLSDYRSEAIYRLKSSGEAFLRKRANVLIADDLR